MKRIMVVDVCPHSLNLTGCYLERNGYQPIQVDDPAEAAMAILTEEPDLVLFGFEEMCYADLDLVTLIRTWPQTAHVPWVLCTPHVTETMRQVGVSVPIDGYLPKPVRELALVQQCQKILSQPRIQTKPGTVYLAPKTAFGDKVTGFWPKERKTRYMSMMSSHSA